MRKGSTKKERNTKTITMIGKKERAYSTNIGSFPGSAKIAPLAVPEAAFLATVSRRAGAHSQASKAQIMPVITAAITIIVGKSKFIRNSYLNLQNQNPKN
jgi:ABC-type dipeptide/oligopeptide/nickel transport system permease component